MYLFADSGSTKTAWRFIDGQGSIHQFSTDGLNPLFNSDDQLLGTINLLPDSWSESTLKGLEFYGSGCIDETQKARIKKALGRRFQADSVMVESDLLGAAKAASSSEPGIVCILGTGSNCCYFDGENILERVPPLGYILGDEGSGTALGKAFLKAYLRNQLPARINEAFRESEFYVDDPLKMVYNSDKPNKYLASLAEFMVSYLNEPLISGLVIKCFEQLTDNIALLHVRDKMSVNFVGSIAFYFQNLLMRVLQSKGYRMGKIIQEPVAALANNYIKNIHESD